MIGIPVIDPGNHVQNVAVLVIAHFVVRRIASGRSEVGNIKIHEGRVCTKARWLRHEKNIVLILETRREMEQRGRSEKTK